MGAMPRVTAEAAAALLRAGGIVAHPTEAVWGLACDPASGTATGRLLALKRRAVDKGLILVAVGVLLLRDEYPPFRLDQGPEEPASALVAERDE